MGFNVLRSRLSFTPHWYQYYKVRNKLLLLLFSPSWYNQGRDVNHPFSRWCSVYFPSSCTKARFKTKWFLKNKEYRKSRQSFCGHYDVQRHGISVKNVQQISLQNIYKFNQERMSLLWKVSSFHDKVIDTLQNGAKRAQQKRRYWQWQWHDQGTSNVTLDEREQNIPNGNNIS